MSSSISEQQAAHMLRWALKNLESADLTAGGGREIRANCPFCVTEHDSEDTKGHLYVNQITPVYICHRCDSTGNWYDLIVAVEGCTFAEAIVILAGVYNVTDFGTMKGWLQSLTAKVEMYEEKETEKTPLPFRVVDRGRGGLNGMVRRYLYRRGIPADLTFSGLFQTLPDEMRVYVMLSEDYWQGRTILSNTYPKYKNPAISKKGILGLFDSPYLDMPQGPLWVVEGAFSGIALWKRNKAVAALLGKRANLFQLERLVELANERGMVIALDADAGDFAWDLAHQLIELGAEEKNIRLALLGQGDPEDSQDFEMHPAGWSSSMRYRLIKESDEFEKRRLDQRASYST